ncbi:prepilin peptidase [Blastopirellula sp. JC732]|uniref:Prepilin peptidase n=1 Tax=Blastopirellula sediminis TaxID=2894196 RepID=A0A9X1MQA0_9BACT|nr:A24 family peptidase [Blastopirellula sediminis]MCC9605327.1 prepilin peptidase [Blastopirellula sediminis]MCC9631373.1 prepilin peptidase [Blastopirellula sediminis]
MAVRRKPNQLRRIVGAALLLFVAILIAWPAIEFLVRSSAPTRPSEAMDRLERLSTLRDWMMNVFGYGWFFAVGAVIGSYLNVVVWRLPRGKSVVDKPSACPFCCTKIRALDNVPVLGWINLEGKCRACRLPISSRYPLVEAAMGMIFVALLIAELLSGGSNLPGGELTSGRGFAGVVFEARWPIIRLYAYHAAFFCWLLPWALIAWDRQRIPKSTVLVAAIVGIGAPLIWPGLHPIAALAIDASPQVTELVTMLVGTAVGLMIGMAVRQLEACEEDDLSRGWGMPTMLAFMGLFLGWQAVVTIAAVILPLYGAAVFAMSERGKFVRRGLFELLMTAATLVYICWWGFWAGLAWLPGSTFSPVGLAVVAPLLLLGFALLAVAKRPQGADWRRFQNHDPVSPPRCEPVEFIT